MRRIVFFVLLSVALASGVPGSADHVFAVPDALDCANSAAPGFGAVSDPAQQDRGAVCTSDGNPANGPEHYVGGEAQTESAYPDDPMSQPGDQCGAVVFSGNVASATRPDDPATPANEQLDWDWMHPHDPDGVPGTGDEFTHHHTCD